MHDPVEVRRRIERLVARVERRDDYAKLLANGEVVRALAQLGRPVEDWRAELRRQARADRIPIRTGTSGTCTWAVISRPPSDDELNEALRRGAQIERASRVAFDLDHDPVVVLADGHESLLRCRACAADGFTDATGLGVTLRPRRNRARVLRRGDYLGPAARSRASSRRWHERHSGTPTRSSWPPCTTGSA